MRVKSLLIIAAIATAGLASAKTYDIQLLGPAKAGNVELKPGEYKLKIEGSRATFTAAQNHESFTVPVKVENATTKFPATQLETASQNGMDVIQAIDLGDSHTRITVAQ